MAPPTRRRIRAAGFVLGVAGLAYAVVKTAGDYDGNLRPSGVALGVAAALALVSLLATGRSWATLLGVRGADRREAVGALYLSQLSKYLPAGGLLQAVGQVSMSAGRSVPVSRAAVAYPVAALEVVVSGAILAAGLALRSDLPTWARVLAAMAPLAVAALHPRVLRTVLALAGRVSRRVPDATHLPTSATIGRSAIWAMLNMAATSMVFTVVVRSVAPGTAVLAVFSAFAAAWVIGFLLVPFPSGLGVREAVLLVAVPSLSPAELLAASLAHRVVTVLAEVVVTVANTVVRRRAARRAARAEP